MDRPVKKPELTPGEVAQRLLDEACVSPSSCTSMAEIRQGIDAIDRALGCLIAERQRYVEQAGVVKQSRDAVRDEDRVQDVIDKARAALIANGGDAGLAETIWRPMVEWFIAHEFDVFDDRSS